MPTKLTVIDSIESLQREQFIVKERLKRREVDLKKKAQQIPGELAVAGANSVIPKMLRGKVTNAALQGGKMLINKFFVKDGKSLPRLLPGAGKKIGLFSTVKNVFRLVRGKK